MKKSVCAVALCLTLSATGAQAGPPASWGESDWVKFIDSAVAITAGELHGAAAEAVRGRAGGTVPLADVYSALSAIGSATKPGLLLWLNKKRRTALLDGDDKRFGRYDAFYNCLATNSCDALRRIQRQHAALSQPEEEAGVGTMVDAFDVPNDKPVKVSSLIRLEKGRTYTIRASGVISDWKDKTEGVDAVWCYAEWRCGKDGEAWNQLRINGQSMSDIAGGEIGYNAGHVYEVRYVGDGKAISVWLTDAQGSAGDNSGAISIEIYRH